jgi:hypothetical protein
MSKPTELIFVGNCQKLIDEFNTCKKTIIKKEDIKVKKGTRPLIFPIQDFNYYPVSFKCKDNIEGPNGSFIAGDFIDYSFGSYGYMRKIIW